MPSSKLELNPNNCLQSWQIYTLEMHPIKMMRMTTMMMMMIIAFVVDVVVKQREQTRNQKHHPAIGDNAYWQDTVTRICCYM